MKRLLIAATILVASKSHACNDNFKFALDKKEHFAGSMLLAGTGVVLFDNPWKTFSSVVAVGAAKEWYDYRHQDRHCASVEDFTYDVLGAAIGTIVGTQIRGLIVKPERKGIFIGYETKFRN